MELTWVFTVLGLVLRLAAIWAFDFPTVRKRQDLLLPEESAPGVGAYDPSVLR